MRQKKSIETEINAFLEEWDYEQISEFFRYIEPLLELYNITEQDDWVAKEVGEDNSQNVRLIRTVYIMSRMCEVFAGRFVGINISFPKLWKRLEKSGAVVEAKDEVTVG